MLTQRRVLVAAVLSLWVAVLGFHVRREYFPAPSARLAAGAKLLAPGTHYYLVRLEQQVIGYARASLDTVDTGFRFDDALTLRVPALGRVHETAATTSVQLDPALTLISFRFRLDSDAGRYEVRGTARDSVLDLVLAAGGDDQHSSLPLEPDFLLGAALPMRLAAAGALEVGREHSWRVFDPSALANRQVTARVTGRDTLVVADSARLGAQGRWEVTVLDTVPVWRLEQSFGGVRVVSWVDEDGQVVREQSPLGYSIERTTYEIARQEWEAARRASPAAASGYGAIIEGTAIASDVDLSDITERSQLAVRLSGVELAGFDLEGGRQQLRGDTLVIVRATPRAAGYTLPYAGGGEVAAALAAEPLIQSDDPRLRAAARSAAGGSTDPVVAARRLNDWVYRTVEKDVALSIPSALQVLETKRGDCNEHTVLYVAMARALGLPARTAVGLVHVRGRFYYHAWPEVWLGEWTAVDPTLGQYPADASHLRFVHGGLARQVELIRLLGRLRLEVQ